MTIMGLCGGYRCGCGVTTDGSIGITGSGEPLDPYVLSLVSNPRGMVGFSEMANSQANISAVSNLTGLSSTFLGIGGRRYRITGQIRVQATVTGDTAALLVTNEFNAQLQQQNSAPLVAGVEQGLPISLLLDSETGEQTVKLRVARATGTGTLTVLSHHYAPSFILVEDVGLAI